MLTFSTITIIGQPTFRARGRKPRPMTTAGYMPEIWHGAHSMTALFLHGTLVTVMPASLGRNSASSLNRVCRVTGDQVDVNAGD